MLFQEISELEKEKTEVRANKKTSRMQNPQYKVVFGVFIILIIFIFIQTLTSSLREKDEIYEKVITERKNLMQFSSTILTSADFNFFNSHKKHIVMRMAEPSGILFCRIVKPSGEIYLSSVESEVGMHMGEEYLKVTETVTTSQEWNGQEIEVMITPTYRGHTLWLGYDYSMVNSDIQKMIFNQFMVSLILTVICIVFYVLLFRYNSRLHLNLFRKRVIVRFSRITRFVQKSISKRRKSARWNSLKPVRMDKEQEITGLNRGETNLKDADDHTADLSMAAAETIRKSLLDSDAISTVLKETERLKDQTADMDNIYEELKKIAIQVEYFSMDVLLKGTEFKTNDGLNQVTGEEVSKILHELTPAVEELRQSAGAIREGLSELSNGASPANIRKVLDLGAAEEIFSEFNKLHESLGEIRTGFESVNLFIRNMKSDKYELFEAVNSIADLSDRESEGIGEQGSFIDNQIEKIKTVYMQAQRIYDMMEELDNPDEQ